MTETRWLTPDEAATWQSLWSVTSWLPARLNQQVKRDSGIRLSEYFVLAQVSMAPGAKLSMTELANSSDMTASRLTHVVERLEKKGQIVRRRDPGDGRTNIAHLTEDGRAFITAAAPGHVDCVRELVFDPLTEEEAHTLGLLLRKVLDAIDPPGLPRT